MNERLLKAAADLRFGVDAGEATDEFQEFLDTLAELGLHPELLEHKAEQAFLRETARLIRKARVPLGEAIADTERRLGSKFYGGDWFSVNLRRSKVQFVRDLYSDLVEVDWDTFLDSRMPTIC